MIDGRWATVGSSNIDPLSLLMAREGNIVMEDERFSAALKAVLEAAIEQNSEPICRQSLAARPWADRLLSWIAMGLARAAGGLIGSSELESS